jgi:EAL domain-containing protein (putative c-di-GMP-specific phosphodiesterase class I)
MHEPEKTLPLLESLRSRGYQLAMDDFGTGYSSFGQLRQMPVRTLKVDRSFVDDLDHDENARSIVAAIIGMGHGLGLEVIAEGVENGEQAEFLLRNHCALMQGYHFSRPLQPEQCPEYLSQATRGALPWQQQVTAL